MKRYRVLHLIDSLGLYGAERVILNLSKEMNDTNFTPIIGILLDNKHKKHALDEATQEVGIRTLKIYLKNKLNPLNINILKNEDI